MYPYRAQDTIPWTDVHKQTCFDFSEWLLSQPADFPDKIFFSNEKAFGERTRPKKTEKERYWYCDHCDPEVEDECKEGKN